MNTTNRAFPLAAVIVTVTLFLNVAPVQAGFDKGNGGDVLVCTTSTTTTIHLLDEVEAQQEWALSDLTRPATLGERLAVLEHHLPDLARQIEQELPWVELNLRFVKDAKLIDLDDDQLYWLPKNCTREQVAIQNSTGVLIDEALWTKMSASSQAKLLSHEILYRTLDRDPRFSSAHRLPSSKPVRFLNALLWSADLEKADWPSLRPTMTSLGLEPLLLPEK